MKTESIIAQGKIVVSNPAVRSAYIEWRLELGNNGPCFAASGWVKYKSGGQCGGQCLDEIAKLTKNPVALRIVEIWREWHLNDLTAGTPEQMAHIDRQIESAKLAHPEIVYSDGSVNYYKLADFLGLNADKPAFLRAGHYELCMHWLKNAGLYEVPLTPDMRCVGEFPEDVVNGKRGYRYGERWLYRAIPDSIVEELKQLAGATL